MVTRLPVALTLTVAALLASSVAFAEDSHRVSSTAPRVEVSKDGHYRVELTEPADDSENASFRFNGVPYLTTSDWNNNLRRQVSAVLVADVNNDGKNDLLVGCYTSSSFPPYPEWTNLIYYNIGGTLEATPSWISGSQVHTGDLAVGDINKDGYPDVFSADGGGGFSPSRIYFGTSSGPSTTAGWIATPSPSTWTTGVALFDFDHDGDLDAFTSNQGVSPNPYRRMLGYRNNDGVMETTPFWQSDEEAISSGPSFGDLDGDGWEDLAVGKWVNFQTAVYKNVNGVLQTFPVWQSGLTGGDRGTAWADVDGDNDLDLAVGRSPMMLYTNTGGVLNQTWAAAPPFSTQPQDMKFVDVDRDGDQDLAEFQFSTGRAHIYLNTNGVLSNAPAYTYDDASTGNAIAFGDINGDGWDDMAIGINGDISVRVFFARIPVIIGDMNCDGLVNLDDVDPFVLAQLDPAAYAAAYPFCSTSRGDVNTDALLDGGDVQGFTNLLTNP